MAYNYCVTAHKPTSVTHAITGNFTSPTDRNLIVAKCTRIEIFLLTPGGLQLKLEVPIYGRITALELFRPQGEQKDLLFLLTERYKLCVLEYDASSGEIITRSGGDVRDPIGRPSDSGQIAVVDPECRMFGLHLYDGFLKVVPVDSQGRINNQGKEAFRIRVEEREVLDLKFLHCTQRPTVAVLYQDQKEARHVKTYIVNEKEKELTEGPFAQQHLDAGASLLIPVPAPCGGTIILGEMTVSYLNVAVQRSIASRATMIGCFGAIDADGSRYLLSDITGTLWLLALIVDNGAVQNLKLDPLGQTSVASAIAYLDSGVVYIGSKSGDSQLVRLHTQADSTGSYLEVVETFTGLGPIVNFCVVDLDRQGQGQVVTCSGIHKDGSLRVVRNGVGINEQASVDLPGVKGLWALKTDPGSAHDAFLVVSFITETRVLAINMEDELDETDIPGFDCGQQSLLCATVGFGQLLQVTPQGARLVSGGTLGLLASWEPPPGRSVTVAAADDSLLLMSTGEGDLVSLALGQGTIQLVGEAKMKHEISCLDVHRLAESRQTLAAVGLWDNALCLLALPGLEPLLREELQSDAIPRSVCLVALEGTTYLLSGMGDGQLLSCVYHPASGHIAEKRIVSLGTQPVSLRPFTTDKGTHVFAGSDRPTVVYSANRKLMYSNVNVREVTQMCSFNCASFPDSLAIASKSTLTIGTIDNIQKLHIRSVPLGEQPRRIAHQEESKTFAVATVRFEQPPDGQAEEVEKGYLRLLDDTTFEVLHSFPLEAFECPCSIRSLQMGEDPRHYYALGTAFHIPDEQEPTRGRILVFHVEDQKLVLVSEKEAKGAVYNINAFNGRLLAGVNSKLNLYKWPPRDDDTRELVVECSHHGHILALYVAVRGDFICVGDLMKSIVLLVYKPEEGAIEERAKDVSSTWMTQVDIIDDDILLGAETHYNLFVCQKNAEAATDEERQRLSVVGEYHLGEMVNCFQRGSLVMRAGDSEAAKQMKTTLFGTVNGVIGVLASLPKEEFHFLHKVQEAIGKVQPKGVGGLLWNEWRSFHNEQRADQPAKNFVDGDLLELFFEGAKQEKQEEVARLVGMSREELAKRVEEFSRLIH